MIAEIKHKESLIQEINVKELKFEPKELTIKYKDLFENAYCLTCFKFHQLKNNRRVPFPEEGLEMLVCYGCRVTVHFYCAGLKTPINEVQLVDKQKVKMFVCDKCKIVGPDGSKACEVCHQSKGMLKLTSNKKFVHVICALSSELYEINDFRTMSIQPTGRAVESQRSQNKACDYCKRPDSLFECESDKCHKRTHIYCAFTHKVKFLAEDEESTEGWSIRMERQNHLSTSQFNIEDSKTYKTAVNLYQSILRASKEYLQPHKNGLADFTLASLEKSKTNEEQVSLDTSKERDNKIFTEEEEQVITDICERAKENMNTLFKEILPVKYNRQGGIQIQCQTDRTQRYFVYVNGHIMTENS